MFEPHITGVIGIVTALIAWSAAAFVLTQVPDRSIARRFSLLLFLEGVMIITSWASPTNWITDFETWRTINLVHVINDSLLVAIYLPTIAVIVDSRMARFFRGSPGIWIPLIIGLGGAALAIARPDWFIGPAETVTPIADERMTFFQPKAGGVWPFVFIFLTISYTYGLIATIRAWWTADSPFSKRKNGILALAFGIRDFFWGTMFLYSTITLFMGIEVKIDDVILSLHIAAAALIAYILLTLYGVASAQLFDIDLKIKWTLQRGTVAAAYVLFTLLFQKVPRLSCPIR